MKPEKIQIHTNDKVELYGLLWKPREPSKKAVLLLHMMPATKESWSDFAEKLSDAGFTVFAIDLRGHGESTKQYIDEHAGRAAGKEIILNYKIFTDEEHQKSKIDAHAAILYLNNLGFKHSQIYVGGASIGANLAIYIMGENKEIMKGMALSPGLNYKGIETYGPLQLLFGIRPGNGQEWQKVYLIASEEDEYSAATCRDLNRIDPENTALKIYSDNAGHGTKIFEKHPELMNELVQWLKF